MKVRVVKALNRRVGKPSLNAPKKTFCKKGTTLDVDEEPVPGDSYEGNSIWYKDASENYYWSGALTIFKEDNSPPQIKNDPAESGIGETSTDKVVEQDDSVVSEKKVLSASGGLETTGSLTISSVNYLQLQKYITDYNIDKLWKQTKGKGVSVAILDSGIDYNSREFVNKVNTAYFNAVINSEMRIDCMDEGSKHGTNCAAILCGISDQFSGVSPDINLNVIKIGDNVNCIDTSVFARGLERAIELKPDIITVCFYIPIDSNLEKIQGLINYAHKQNIVIISAVGNFGFFNFPVNNYPASFSECISVGSVNESRTRNPLSSMSDFLNLMAPGEGLVIQNSLVKIDNTGYATAFVTGLIALLLSINKLKGKSTTVQELYSTLYTTSDKNFSDYNVLEYGWGIINPLAYSGSSNI